MEKQIIEINGVKFEVDVAKLTLVTEFKVGDAVKILKKKYTGTFESYSGVIVGIDNFKSMPTACIAYLEITYNECKLEFAYFNEKSEDMQVVPISEGDYLAIEKSRIVELLDLQIQKKELELREAKGKKLHFLAHFGKLFRDVLPEAEQAELNLN